MSRVLLVSSNQEQRPYPVPPVGLCLLAEALMPRFEVQLFDSMFAPAGALEEKIRDFQPDLVGLSIRNADDPRMDNPHSYIQEILESSIEPIRRSTGAPILLGGAGFSIFPQEMLEAFRVDIGVVGEAEHIIVELVETILSGGDPRPLSGVVTRGSSNNGSRAPVRLDGQDGPIRIGPSHIDRWLEFAPYRARGAYSIQTKRGCAQRCIYCSYPGIEGCSTRRRDPEAIAGEIIEASERLGAITFEFVDSVFNDPPGHAEAICRALVRRNHPLRLRTMGLNPRGVTRELLELMRAAGFAQIDCTPDSASPRMLESLGKGFSREELENTALLIREVELPTMWFLLFGGPGENERTIEETMDFVDRFIAEDDMVFLWLGLRIYPKTRLHPVALRERFVTEDQNLLEPPAFYLSPELDETRTRELIDELCQTRPNCIPAWDARPDPEMIRMAGELRAREKLEEPMFRTLMRIRRQRMASSTDKQ